MKYIKEKNGVFCIQKGGYKTMRIILCCLLLSLLPVIIFVEKEMLRNVIVVVLIGFSCYAAIMAFVESLIVALSYEGVDTFYSIMGQVVFRRHWLDAGEYVLVAIQRPIYVSDTRGRQSKEIVSELYIKTKENEYLLYNGGSLARVYEVKREVEEVLSHLLEFTESGEIDRFAHGFRGL